MKISIIIIKKSKSLFLYYSFLFILPTSLLFTNSIAFAQSPPSAQDLTKQANLIRSYFDSDAVFDQFDTHADTLEGGRAPLNTGMSYTSIPGDALESVMNNGVQSGFARGNTNGENAKFIWFAEGKPFYDGITLAIPTDRLKELGGYSTTGLAGQEGVIRVPHDSAPNGIPFKEFSVTVSVGYGFSVPLYVPDSMKNHPISVLPPDDVIHAGNMPESLSGALDKYLSSTSRNNNISVHSSQNITNTDSKLTLAPTDLEITSGESINNKLKSSGAAFSLETIGSMAGGLAVASEKLQKAQTTTERNQILSDSLSSIQTTALITAGFIAGTGLVALLGVPTGVAGASLMVITLPLTLDNLSNKKFWNDFKLALDNPQSIAKYGVKVTEMAFKDSWSNVLKMSLGWMQTSKSMKQTASLTNPGKLSAAAFKAAGNPQADLIINGNSVSGLPNGFKVSEIAGRESEMYLTGVDIAVRTANKEKSAYLTQLTAQYKEQNTTMKNMMAAVNQQTKDSGIAALLLPPTNTQQASITGAALNSSNSPSVNYNTPTAVNDYLNSSSLNTNNYNNIANGFYSETAADNLVISAETIQNSNATNSPKVWSFPSQNGMPLLVQEGNSTISGLENVSSVVWDNFSSNNVNVKQVWITFNNGDNLKAAQLDGAETLQTTFFPFDLNVNKYESLPNGTILGSANISSTSIDSNAEISSASSIGNIFSDVGDFFSGIGNSIGSLIE